ncbi:hypothetical protein [Rhodopirellula bahusiensis]|uniref:Transmembrane protein n=1 Tax=Rhodopirellula bahusiensis TaxID=2014065 RepID=A0A2G1W0I2_9BACT|nr:hypothetical protein [Rhodopirellula bahusiensis]PHQ32546.1 hypothetical protein CEE69_25015 [Rhodopirellula bahusiensis]
MSEFLLYYRRPDPTTWVYMSSFLTIGLFFVFRRFWSIRNLDIVLLILLAPGLLMVNEGYRRQTRLARLASAEISAAANTIPVEEEVAPEEAAPAELSPTDKATSESGTIPDEQPVAAEAPAEPESPPAPRELTAEELTRLQESEPYRRAAGLQRAGFITLFGIQFLVLVRMLLDPLMVRRPLLDPNLTTGGLNFLGISLFIFMMANVVASTPEIQQEQGPKLGPGYALINMLPAIPTRPISEAIAGAEPPTMAELTAAEQRRTMIAKIIAILAQSAVLIGILLIGNRHFGNLRAGAGCATLYLLMPYTAQMTGRVDHVVPAALILWAVLMYRKPLIAGLFIGAAAGLLYYPLFLLPLWCSFYWQRGVGRFAGAVLVSLTVLMALLAFAGGEPFLTHVQRMFGVLNPNKGPNELTGIWELGWNPIWRLPVIVGYVILSFFFAVWPGQKNLGILISCSAALMVAAQFWHGYGGGLYMAWFLPLLLLTIFRPNLQDRVATKVIDGRSRPSRRSSTALDAA